MAVETCRGRVPIIAGTGGAARGTAIALAARPNASVPPASCSCPHYLTEASQDGLSAHVEAVCRVGRDRRDRLQPQRLPPERRHPRTPGRALPEPDRLQGRHRRDRADGEHSAPHWASGFAYLGGLPTAEVFAAAYKALGVPVYSSAVFNFIPKTALEFYAAVGPATTRPPPGRLLDEFFLPYLGIRNRRAGYAVSIVKAGARLVGRDAGPVRPPLTDLSSAEVEELDALIRKLGPQ